MRIIAVKSWKSEGQEVLPSLHKLKRESFYLRAGRLLVRVKRSAEATELDEFLLEPGDCMDVPIGLVHQLEALEDAELFEFSTQHFDIDSY